MIDQEPATIVSRIPVPTGPVVRENVTSPHRLDQIASPNFFIQVSNILASAIKVLPGRLRKDGIWLGPLALLWLLLWTIKPMTLWSLPSPLQSLIHVLIFLTATYNGFLGKAVFVTVVGRTFIPMFKSIRSGQFDAVKRRYSRTIGIIRQAASASRAASGPIMLISAGAAFAVSNFLTRNNRIDKYFVCLLSAVALLDDLSHGAGSPVVKLITSGLRDIPRLVGKKTSPSMRQAYLATGGFSIGLILAFIPGFLNNSFTSPSGIYLGLVVAIAGVILMFARKKSDHQTESIASQTGKDGKDA